MDRSIPPLSLQKPEFSFPRFNKRTLSNGMHVVLLNDSSSELISISLTMRVGAVHEQLSGLARAVAGLMISGTSSKTAEDISMLIDRLGLSFGFSASWDSFECSSIGLAEHTNAIVNLLSECLFDARFPEEELKLKKELMIAEHEHYSMDPEYLAARASSSRMFMNHPYANSRIGIPSSIAQYDRETCMSFHKKLINTSEAFFTVSGKFDPDAMMHILESSFAHWRPNDSPPEISQVEYHGDMKCIIAPKPEAVQTAIHIAFPSIGLHHPDYPLFRIASTAFGGYFASRINHTLREVHGYTYGAFAQSYGRKGANTYNIQTQIGNEVTKHGIELIFEELHKMREYPLGEEECETVIQYVLGTMIQGMETNQQVSSRMKMIEFNHLDEHYHSFMFDHVAKAEREKIFEVQKVLFNPTHCVISASGSKELLEPILHHYGETLIFQEV